MVEFKEGKKHKLSVYALVVGIFKSLFVGSVGYPGLKFCTVIKKVLIKLPLQIMELQDQFYQEIQGALVLHQYAL